MLVRSFGLPKWVGQPEICLFNKNRLAQHQTVWILQNFLSPRACLRHTPYTPIDWAIVVFQAASTMPHQAA
ncbi:hypothetical protein [uncultured Kingella sp.]|uniref:hypothetical protein n=1 Tax=uncultured Kingella sp. TaxID=159270 RepID=UPI00259660EF|nr:hypothetical protein [uncultured Kingella sp.]